MFTKEEYRARYGPIKQEDEGRYTQEQLQKEIAERQERERQEAEESRKRLALASWKAAGGAEKDFEATWRELDAEDRKRRLTESARAAREAMRASPTSRI